MNESPVKPNKAIVAIIVVALVGGVGVGAYYLTQNKTESTETTAQTTASSDTSTSASKSEETAVTGAYKDGTYTATGSYDSPGGQEEIKVQLTLSGGKVTDATVTSLATNPTSKQYQAEFISGYKSQVVGKSIDEIKLDTVGGSSLTSSGFNDAVEQIKQDATA